MSYRRATPQPNFKVGDKVISRFSGKTGTVREVCWNNIGGGWTYRVFFGPNSWQIYFCSEDKLRSAANDVVVEES